MVHFWLLFYCKQLIFLFLIPTLNQLFASRPNDREFGYVGVRGVVSGAVYMLLLPSLGYLELNLLPSNHALHTILHTIAYAIFQVCVCVGNQPPLVSLRIRKLCLHPSNAAHIYLALNEKPRGDARRVKQFAPFRYLIRPKCMVVENNFSHRELLTT